MLSRLRVEMAAPRYAKVLIVLQQAKRSWHRLDAALVSARQSGTAASSLVEAHEALASLDRQLDRLTTLLGYE
jgi:hypothetical protein